MQGEGGSGIVPFTSSNPSILLYYQTTVLVVCSFIHYLAKKRIGRVNAVCSNWYKMCSQLKGILEKNLKLLVLDQVVAIEQFPFLKVNDNLRRHIKGNRCEIGK